MRVKALGTLLVAAACNNLQEAPPPPFQVSIMVEADKGVPLPNAVIERNNEQIAKTDGSGKAIMTFVGAEGDQLEVWVKCPEGFDSPAKPTTIILRRLSGDTNKLAEYPAMCPPALRKVVIAVRADNGGNLPIRFLNHEKARTDAWGAATFMLEGKPGDRLDFTLDTSEKGNEMLRPQSPTIAVVVDAKDNYYSMDQPFQIQKRTFVYQAPHRPQAIGPTPLRY
jgi:hypothetical protein